MQEYRREGNLIWPLLVDHVRPDMRLAWEEPFGLVLPVIRISTAEEGIHHCNTNNFALQNPCPAAQRTLFDNISERNVVSWNAMIAGYAHNGLAQEALVLFEQMQREGMKPTEVTYISVLSTYITIHLPS
ncbi:hypothetical protein O6H91_01G143000 [Diphasiastrum complanatum]|uniref:Uncharacterized protein n=1 Tax=Diphasiastrum complanatum TaxID=34168 RepID=A0ACC2EWU6_DIPCM|nr:hypothetical protein O6H91_01G143000 [Diphasiastrum complanatum]